MATSEVSPSPTPSSEVWAEKFTVALRQQRDRVRAFFVGQQVRLKRAETQLFEQLKQFADELARGRVESSQAKEEIRQRSEQLTRQIEGLEDLRRESAARQAEWEQAQQRAALQQEAVLEQLRRQQDELQRSNVELQQRHASAQAALIEQLQSARQRETELAAEARSLRQRCDQLTRQCAEASQSAGLGGDGEEVRQHSEQLTRQIESLEELRREFAARQAEWEQAQQQAALQQEALLQQVRQQQEELHRCNVELQQQHADEQAALQQQLQSARQRETELAAEARSLRQRCDLLTQQCAEAARSAGLGEDRADIRQHAEQLTEHSEQLTRQIESLESLRREFAAGQAEWGQAQQRAALQQEALLEQLRHQQEELRRRGVELQQQHADEQAALQQQLQSARQRETELAAEARSLRQRCDLLAQQCAQASSPADPGKEQEIADFRRRYAMALEDLGELKARNAELQQQLAKARVSTLPPGESANGVLDWEAQKRRILEALEADGDANDPQREAKLPKLDAMLQATEQALAEKDREIVELKQLLQDQSANLGAVAVGAAALGEILDKDAIIREERENVKRLQEQWREKLRQAEIEISLQRATVARDRAQIEEKLHQLANCAAKPGEKATVAENANKPPRGRWLARLGLKEPE